MKDFKFQIVLASATTSCGHSFKAGTIWSQGSLKYEGEAPQEYILEGSSS